MNILTRKPRRLGESDYILVDRGGVSQGYDRPASHGHRFVVATATPHSLSFGEWFWGHYFENLPEAMAYFNACVSGHPELAGTEFGGARGKEVQQERAE